MVNVVSVHAAWVSVHAAWVSVVAALGCSVAARGCARAHTGRVVIPERALPSASHRATLMNHARRRLCDLSLRQLVQRAAHPGGDSPGHPGNGHRDGGTNGDPGRDTAEISRPGAAAS